MLRMLDSLARSSGRDKLPVTPAWTGWQRHLGSRRSSPVRALRSDQRGSAGAAAGEEAADRGAGAEAGELGEGAGEGEGELEGRVAAGFDGGALTGGDVFHGAARDGARAVAADLD